MYSKEVTQAVREWPGPVHNIIILWLKRPPILNEMSIANDWQPQINNAIETIQHQQLQNAHKNVTILSHHIYHPQTA